MITEKEKRRNLNFKWCIDNDFQVYLVPTTQNRYKVAVMRKGITTEGKDFIYVRDVRIESKVILTEKEFKNAKEASEHTHEVREALRKEYG